MPKSKPRKRPRPQHVDYRGPAMVASSRVDEPAPHALAAEATGALLEFAFRDHQFTVDPATVDFGRAMFAMKIAERGGNISAQLDRMLDCFESILGQEQVATLYDVAPDLFSNEDTQREFWEAFTALTVGASLGEPSAS